MQKMIYQMLEDPNEERDDTPTENPDEEWDEPPPDNIDIEKDVGEEDDDQNIKK